MENSKEDSRASAWSALSLAWELGYTIAVPLVLFAFGGRFIDRWLGTEPWIMLGGILVSIMLTSYLVYRKVVKILVQ